MTRYAIRTERYTTPLVVQALTERIHRYLPSNYRATTVEDRDGVLGVLITGEDVAGWTMEDYVIPRLASGLYFVREVTAEQAADFRPLRAERAA